jgi:predicted NBD/HSP70 family sugar kinase
VTLLGIDIGGTGIKGAPVDVETGQLVGERFRIETPCPAMPNAVADVVEQIAEHFSYRGPTGVTFPAVAAWRHLYGSKTSTVHGSGQTRVAFPNTSEDLR